MTIGEELARLRSAHLGCHSVLFADLSTGMVLAASTAQKTAQEKLDFLCQQARACFLVSGTEGSADAPPLPFVPITVWRADANGLYCFVKAPAPAQEALCIAASADVALDCLCADAGKLLALIAAEG